GKATTPSAWVLVPPCTLRRLWSTWLLKSLSLPAMPPVTTRRLASSHVTCSWPSATTRNLTSSSPGHHCTGVACCPNIQAVLLPKKTEK
ncbi:hypothetical protein O3P69_016175, partial [Scylla paramamosain]